MDELRGGKAKQFLGEYFSLTEELTRESFETQKAQAFEIGNLPGEMTDRLEEMSLKGKKLRGALMLLGYRLCGGVDEERLLKTSVMLEVVHTGFLVHDDIMDRDDMRRGLVSIHKHFEGRGRELGLGGQPEHFGESMAICVGDMAYFMAFDILMNSGFPEDALVKAGKVFTEYALRIVHGQVLDVASTKIDKASESETLNIFKYKTAEYTGCLPLLLGAVLAGEKDEKKLQLLYEYGVTLGWPFQIQDDILGLFGDDEIGKPVGSDLREGKNTLLMLRLFKKGSDEQKKFQKEVLGNGEISREDVEKMKRILKESGVYDEVYGLGMEYVRKGHELADRISDNPEHVELLKSMLSFMMERVK